MVTDFEYVVFIKTFTLIAKMYISETFRGGGDPPEAKWGPTQLGQTSWKDYRLVLTQNHSLNLQVS